MYRMRKPETQEMYEEYLNSGIDVKSNWSKVTPKLESSYWKIIKNEFPYDALDITRHDLLIPKRNFSTLSDANQNELNDLVLILKVIDDLYSYTRQNTRKGKTIHEYFHIHLIRESNFVPENDLLADYEDFTDYVVDKFKKNFKKHIIS